MTEDAINRLVAERVMGAALEPPCGRYHSTDEAERDSDGWHGWCYTCGCSISEVAPEPLRYTSDPAAWGALLVWLTKNRAPRGVSLNWWPDEEMWEAEIGVLEEEPPIDVYDPLPGRALSLAALRAYGVEVESGA